MSRKDALCRASHSGAKPQTTPIMPASSDSRPDASRDLLGRLQRDEAALYENTRDWRFDGVIREYASLHALLDLQFSQIGDRLARLAARCGNFRRGGGHAAKEHVLAIRRQDGTYDVCESEIVTELAELHVALSASLEQAAEVFRKRLGETETAAVLSELAEHHKKDAAMLRALLSENNPA